uniref:Neuregulin C-terminal domain-containing protein n=1 Tax=Knipowitschia caucasica TaxID=637954 RepID=A0AAV2JKW0_KNICA
MALVLSPSLAPSHLTCSPPPSPPLLSPPSLLPSAAGRADHLGIEFMESKEASKRQVLSITSIVTAISLLGLVCMALYHRNKRHREKLQAHLKEHQTLKNYNSHHALGEDRPPSSSVQTYQNYKKLFQCPESSLNHCSISNSFCRCSRTATPPRKGLTFFSSGPHVSALSKPASFPRGRLQMGLPKCSDAAYKHLRDRDPSRPDPQPLKGSGSQSDCHYSDLCQDTFLHIRSPVQDNKDKTSTFYLQSTNPPMEQRLHEEPALCPSSIPIIPSIHCHYDVEVSHQRTLADQHEHSVAQQQEHATLLLEDAQQQLKAVAQCKHARPTAILEANETVCFLHPNAKSTTREPQIQILSRSKTRLSEQ